MFWQFPNEFLHFSKNCESLKSDASWIFRVIDWTSYIVSYFKPTKYHLLNDKVISHGFIVHIYFKLHTSFVCNYHFITTYQIVSSWQVSEASEMKLKHCFINLCIFHKMIHISKHFFACFRRFSLLCSESFVESILFY